MKIVLSKDEMEILIRNHYALPSETMVEISKPKKIRKTIPKEYIQFRDRFNDTMNLNEKIAAIKALREIVPDLGLYGAKCAVESFDRVTEYVLANKAWPQVNDRCFVY